MTLPSLGKVHAIPFLNIGIMQELQKMMHKNSSAIEIADAILVDRVKIEDENGVLRGVNDSEKQSITDEDRGIFAQEFLKYSRRDGVKVEDFETPVDALIDFVKKQLELLQASQKEISEMIKSGFSDKTINIYRESQDFARRLVAENSSRIFPEIVKTNSYLNTFKTASEKLQDEINSTKTASEKLRNEINSAAMQDALKTYQESNLLPSTGICGSSALLPENPLVRGGDFFERPSVRQRDNSQEWAQNIAQRLRDLPPMKTGEQVMSEQLGLLKDDLGNRMDRVGDAIAGIALQQENTNSVVISALSDMRSKWKDDEKSSRVALWVAACSLVCSIFLTGYGIYQDHESNISGDKYQEQITRLMKQQNELAETQRQLLDQIAKSNAKLSTFRGEEKK